MSKLDGLKNSLTRNVYRVGFQFKKHSPEILVGAGIVGTVAASVMACKATTKAGAIKAEMQEQMEEVHEVAELGTIETKNGVVEYTEQDLKKDTAKVYLQTGIKYAKLYAPAITLGTVSILSILAGHNITRKRNVALAAAYATIDKGFKEYRSRVVERFGEDLDRELKYNIKAKEFDTVEVNEKGKEKVKKETVQVSSLNEYSDYARFFDDGCAGWDKDAEYNLMFLRRQQDYANDMLRTRGHLFLNEVYDMLGIPRTKAGNAVGWVYNEKNPSGDNYVDFGIYEGNKEVNRNFVNGYERTILLDFNVDGDILELI